MAAPRRAAPPTHPTVWIGLGLAAAGLLVAAYAYTGTRVYDILYAAVALGGGVLAFAGILVAAWGRAVMSSRVSRERRQTMSRDALKLAEDMPPPTVAEPATKKRFTFPKPSAILARRAKEEPQAIEAAVSGKGALFAFRRQSQAPPPVAEPLPVPAPGAALERLKLKCPSCAQQFTAEGTRPFTATCPHCGFAADV